MNEPATNDMRRAFASRDEMITYLRAEFPQAVANGDEVAEIRGGRVAALAALEDIDPAAYTASRNYLKGRVTRLSPYIRHGVISLVEAKRAALAKARKRGDADKLINELAWRDYWQRLYREVGGGVWQDREESKTAHKPESYSPTLPDDIREGETGLDCIDHFARTLVQTGYLHNHARMWMAAYVVHWRHVQWQAGARWFLAHLLDGDPASNNLSWQWVASTNSAKPYYFNRENVERFTDKAFCPACPLRDACPFEGTYEEIEARLFPKMPPSTREARFTGWGGRK